MIPWFAVPGAVLIGMAPSPGCSRARRLSAGRCVSHHLRARARCLPVDDGLHGHGDVRGHRSHLADEARACRRRGRAPLGAWFTFLALATGSIWGRPMWGTWWEWGDPRLTSELIMLFLYFGYMALRSAIDDTTKADKASAVLALVGAVNIPSSTSRLSGGVRCTRARP